MKLYLAGPSDSGTAWECGYAYGKKPVVLVRTDMRVQTANDAPYNPMRTGSAAIRLDLPLGSMAEVKRAVLDALATLEAGP
jgi:nucleoside 2-deoxyribosyltransferase